MLDLGFYKVIQKDNEFLTIRFMNLEYSHIICIAYDNNYDEFTLNSIWKIIYSSANNMYILKQNNIGTIFIYKPMKEYMENIML